MITAIQMLNYINLRNITITHYKLELHTNHFDVVSVCYDTLTHIDFVDLLYNICCLIPVLRANASPDISALHRVIPDYAYALSNWNLQNTL